MHNFLHYSLANQFLDFVKRIHLNLAINSWIKLEQAECNNIKISDLPFIGSIGSIHQNCLKKTQPISSALIAWWKTLEINKSQITPCMYTYLWHNPNFHLIQLIHLI